MALGGGAVRGLAHIGVLEVLQKEGIPISMIAGTSMGALIGAIYARTEDATLMKNRALDLDWKTLASLVDITLPRTGLIKGKRVTDFLRTIIGGNIKFADLKIPLACVATDILTYEEVVIRDGSVLEAVRASASIPAVFTLAEWNGRYLVDGGLVNPVPVSVLRKMGADFIIAVNISPDVRERSHQMSEEEIKELKKPNIFSVIMESLHIATHSLSRSCLEGADIIVAPQVAHIGFANFHRIQECILQGEIAAQDCIAEIKKWV